jgi:N-acetylglucosamine-6-phosphate deacetylase
MQRVEANLVGGGFVRVTCAGGLIDRVQNLGEPQPGAPFISPGFIDLQINGFAGLHFSDPDMTPGDMDRLLHALWATGTTTLLPTLISNTPEGLQAAFRKLEDFRKTHPRFASSAPAYHLEGPYLSPGPSAGAHKAEYMRNPDWDEFSGIATAAGHRIALVTLAPEWPGAEAFIRRAIKAGVRVALSHTDGSPGDVHRAADAGASLNTHLGNGCPQLLDRHQAPFWAQLDDERLAAGIICDGFHLSPEMVRIIARLKGPDRCILVSDAVFVAGLEPGSYDLAGKPIELLLSGQVVTADRRSMAGSTLDMATAVGNYRKLTGCPLSEAVNAATSVPAAYLKLPGLCRAIEPGQPANLVLFHFRHDRLSVEQTVLAGETVFTRASPHHL